jgi:hypothetical protein
MTTTRRKLGEMLVESRAIDPQQLESALGHQSRQGGRLGTLLVQLGFLTEDRLVEVLGRQLEIPGIRLATSRIDPRAVEVLPVAVAELFNAFPLELKQSEEAETLVVAMGDPTDLRAIDQLELQTSRRIEALLAGEQDVSQAIRRHYYGDALLAEIAGMPGPGPIASGRGQESPVEGPYTYGDPEIDEFETLDMDFGDDDLERAASDAPVETEGGIVEDTAWGTSLEPALTVDTNAALDIEEAVSRDFSGIPEESWSLESAESVGAPDEPVHEEWARPVENGWDAGEPFEPPANTAELGWAEPPAEASWETAAAESNPDAPAAEWAEPPAEASWETAAAELIPDAPAAEWAEPPAEASWETAAAELIPDAPADAWAEPPAEPEASTAELHPEGAEWAEPPAEPSWETAAAELNPDGAEWAESPDELSWEAATAELNPDAPAAEWAEPPADGQWQTAPLEWADDAALELAPEHAADSPDEEAAAEWATAAEPFPMEPAGEAGWALLGIASPTAEDAVRVVGALVELLVNGALIDPAGLTALVREAEDRARR